MNEMSILSYRLPVQLRTTFSRICLFNDPDFETRSLFYIEWKMVGRELNSGETERVRERERDRVLLRMGYGMGNKLDRETNIYYSKRKDNPRSYQN
jgi:hypothetical protein